MNRTEILQQFLAERKGLINVSGLAKAIGKSVGYFQNVCRGFKMHKGERHDVKVSDEIWNKLLPLMKLCGYRMPKPNEYDFGWNDKTYWPSNDQEYAYYDAIEEYRKFNSL